jgi:hypothetical protein
MKKSAWARWRTIARRAAEIQAQALFFLLYVLALVPLGLLHPASRRTLTRMAGPGPEWNQRDVHPIDLAASRRQY